VGVGGICAFWPVCVCVLVKGGHEEEEEEEEEEGASVSSSRDTPPLSLHPSLCF